MQFVVVKIDINNTELTRVLPEAARNVNKNIEVENMERITAGMDNVLVMFELMMRSHRVDFTQSLG